MRPRRLFYEDFGQDDMAPPGLPAEPMPLTPEERLEALLAIDEPDLDSLPEEEFEASPLEAFLERAAAMGMLSGLQQPRGFMQGLVSGVAQGASRGTSSMDFGAPPAESDACSAIAV